MAEELEAGTAYVQLLPGARDLQKQTDQAVKKVKAPDIEAKITADISKLETQAAKARQVVESLKSAKADPQIGLDIAAAQAKAQVIEQRLAKLRGQEASVKVDADIAQAESQLGRIATQVQRLEAKRASPKVDADISAAEAKVSAVESQIRRLEGQRAQVRIDADGASQAMAEISAVGGAARRLNGTNASVNIAASGGAQASGILGAIVAGLAAVSAAAPAAAAGLATVFAAGSAAAQAGGTIAAGFSGIGDAIKAVEADEKAAATTSAGAASSRSNSAGQIASAQSSLAQAVLQADRAAITGGQQVAQARSTAARTQVQGADSVADSARAESRARQQADRTAITSGQQLAESRRAVTDAVVAANERTQAAERSVSRAQDSARFSQEGLTRARRAAAEANQDLQLSLSGIAISEKRAQLALEKAVAARNSGGDVDPEMFKGRELDLDVAEANQNLKEVKERFGDLREEQGQFARGGIEGSEQVVAAQRAVREANLGVEDSVRSLTTTQRDGARSVQDAVSQSAMVQQQSLWATQDANDAVSESALATSRASRDAAWANQDSALAVQQAVQQSAWSQQDAARGVSEAQRGLQEALAQTAESAGAAGTAGKQSAFQLAQLTPAGRDFVDFWTKTWKPSMQDVTDSVAGQLLPRVQRSMLQLLGLQPELRAGLSGTAGVLGDLAVKGSDLATSPAFRASFVQIMDSNNRALGSWGSAALSGADSARALTVAGLPLSERLARTADAAAQSAQSFILQKESTGELAEFMEYAGDRAGQLVTVVLDLAEAGVRVGMALEPVGAVVLDLVGGVASAVGEFASANQGLVQFIATAGIAVAGVNALAKATVALQASYAIASGGVKTLASVIGTGLNPAALYNTQVMGKVRDGFAAAGYGAGVYTAGATGSAKAGAAAAGVTRGLGTALTGLGAALPLVGAAFVGVTMASDAMWTNFDEGVEAMGKGGASAAKFRAELAENQKQHDEDAIGLMAWSQSVLGGVETTESFNKKLAEQRPLWSNLQNAQYDAGIAQGNYEQAVKDFGAASPQATSALGELNTKTRDVEIAQIAVREKTDLATAALLYQRDQILAGLDADLRLRMSKQQLAKDEQALADAIAASGPASQAAGDAQLQLETTQLRTAEAAKSSAGGQKAYTDSIKEMVANTKGELTPTLAGMVGSLDSAGLAAIGATVKIDDTGRAVATLPNGKTVVLDANTSPALTGIAGVAYQLGMVPPGKTITVTALTEAEQQKLRDLGFTVTQIPGTKDISVTANDMQARNTLSAFQEFAKWQQANPQLAADPKLSYDKMNEFLTNAGKQTGVPALDANPAKADATVRAKLDEFNRWSAAPAVHADVKPADDEVKGWWGRLLDWFKTKPVVPAGQGVTPLGAAPGGIGQGRAGGGLVDGYAIGGRVQHKQVFGRVPGAAGGLLIGPGTGTSDSILGVDPRTGVPTSAVSNGEYVVRERAVQAIGVPALNAINGLRSGGLVGYAAGGGVRPRPGSPAPAAATGAAIPVPTGDPAAAAGAGAATEMLAGAMGLATTAADGLQPALAAVTAQQQSMVSSGVSPLAAALTGQLVPAVAAGNAQVGVAAPLAHQSLQAAQAQTQLSTGLTAQNAAANNAGIAATTAGMSLAAQVQHAGLRAGQAATQASTATTAANAAVNNSGIAATTAGMSAAAQAQHAGLRGGQAATQQSTTQTAQNVAVNSGAMTTSTQQTSTAQQFEHGLIRGAQNLTMGQQNALAQNTAQNTGDMSLKTGQMSGSVQGALGGVRNAQGVTTGATTGFADSWRTQMGRTVPDSQDPLRHVIRVPIGGVVGAWNTIDQQFALGKHVNPPAANFATGGVMPGYTPGRDVMTANVSGGEAIMRPEWTRAVGREYVDGGNAAARRGGVAGVRSFLTGDRARGRALQQAMATRPLDDSPRAARQRRGWAGSFAYGGVAPHVAAAGDAVTRALGPMPGGIGGRGSRGNASDHPSGHALDFMTMSNMPLGDRVAGMLSAQAEPFSLKYLIWKQAINQGRGWNPMEDRGSPTANHFDHVHASFEGGPLGGSWGDGPAGGSMFDFGSLIRDAFKFVYDQVAEVPKLFGPSDQVARGAGIPKAGADMAIDSLIQKMSTMFSFGGGGGVPDAALANLIIGVGKAMGFPRKGPEVALATAFQESGLRNLGGGDRDSLGVFQQRPSQGWGTPAQIMDPRYSAGKFYSALRGVRGWEGMPHTVAAQAVQRSAFPDAYAKWVGQAVSLVNASGLYDNGGLIPDDGIAVNRSGLPELGLDPVETRSYDTLTRLVGTGDFQLDLGDFEPRGETHNHFLENGVIRETVDLDQVMSRADFLAGTGSL